MNRLLKSSSVLASVIAMFLWVSGNALADGGRYDNDWNRCGDGWNARYEGCRGHYAPYYRGYYPGHYPRYYTHYYPSPPPCGTCALKKNSHHNNNNGHNGHWWQ